MNRALQRYADNPIIDELVFWAPKDDRVVSVRACTSMFRKPFIEVELQSGEFIHRHFDRDGFVASWAQARVILETLTDIELLSEFNCPPFADRERLAGEILQQRDECIAETDRMFAEGSYQQFILQYGANCRNLPDAAARKIATARRLMSGEC